MNGHLATLEEALLASPGDVAAWQAFTTARREHPSPLSPQIRQAAMPFIALTFMTLRRSIDALFAAKGIGAMPQEPSVSHWFVAPDGLNLIRDRNFPLFQEDRLALHPSAGHGEAIVGTYSHASREHCTRERVKVGSELLWDNSITLAHRTDAGNYRASAEKCTATIALLLEIQRLIHAATQRPERVILHEGKHSSLNDDFYERG